MNIIVENIPKMEKNAVMELGVVFIVVVGIADVSGSRWHCHWGSYYLNKKKLAVKKKKKKKKMVPLFQVVMCRRRRRRRSGYHSTNELVIYKNKNRKQEKKTQLWSRLHGQCWWLCVEMCGQVLWERDGNVD